MTLAVTDDPIANPSRTTLRAKLILAARIVVVVIIYAVIFRAVDVEDIVARLTPATGLAFSIGVVILFLQNMLCTARWRLLVPPPTKVPAFSPSFWIYLENGFLNQAMPSTIAGDAWRIVRWRAEGVSTAVAAASVFMDRVSGATAAALLAMLASWMLWTRGVGSHITLPILALSLFVIGANVGLFAAVRWPFLSDMLRPFARVHHVVKRMRESIVSEGRYVLSLAYSFAGHAMSGLAIYIVAQSLNVDLPLLFIIALTGAVLLVTMIPISLAGWGMREAALLTILAPLNVNAHDAVLMGILFGLIGLVATLPAGVSLLIGRRKAADAAMQDRA
jgi:uncharacterized protein (TIRG00374 family)